MIPQPGEPGADTWPGDSRIYGGAGPWIAGSYDHDLKMYFTGTANAYPWNPYGERQGAGSEGNNANVSEDGFAVKLDQLSYAVNEGEAGATLGTLKTEDGLNISSYRILLDKGTYGDSLDLFEITPNGVPTMVPKQSIITHRHGI
jgi:hypothetical protein